MPVTQPQTHIIESGQPLETSVLWRWMKNFYAKGGAAVWSQGEVPFHITNTPAMASDWARSVLAFLRDFHSRGLLQQDHPITVLELGPGIGRHAFFLLRELERLEELSKVFHPQGFRFCLELAELGRSGLRTLTRHPQFKKAMAEDRLRFSLFDAESDDFPTRYPKKSKGKPNLPSPNPVFVMANYFIDSLPHDLVWIRKGEPVRAEATVGVVGLKPAEDPNKTKDLGGRIELSFSYPDEPTEYPNAHWNTILKEYATECEDSHIPFPTVSLRLLERMRNWSQVGTVLMVADKSFNTTSQLVDLEEPELVAHGGGFSFNANVQALSRYAQLCGGMSGHTTCRDGTLDLSHLLIPAPGVKLTLPFREADFLMTELERFHSVDRFRVKESLDEMMTSPDMRTCLDTIRLSGFDPETLYELSDHMLDELETQELEEEVESELLWCLGRCLSLTFPVGDDVDVAFEVGRLAYRMECYELAHTAFELSLERFGDDPKAYFNIGLGWFYRRGWKKAKAAFKKALKLDKKYEDAQIWLEKTERAEARTKNPT